jgi:hypothetical protein
MSQSTSQVLTLHQSEAATPRQYHSAAYLNGKPSNAKQTSSSNLVDPSNSYSQSLSELSGYPNQSANTSIAYQSSKSAMLSQVSNDTGYIGLCLFACSYYWNHLLCSM